MSILSLSYHPEPDSHIWNKIRLELDLPNNTTKKEIKRATGVDTSNVASKNNFFALKAKVDKLDINRLVNVSTSLNNKSIWFRCWYVKTCSDRVAIVLNIKLMKLRTKYQMLVV